ncbi:MULTISPECIES: hypothetical protein [Francisella]|uniref:Tyrosine specific protein phosphatases domain-containing protein n=1 Tax=Francisella opportunistica TaxID=2016517 RepID=A0A345JTK2_9GAMM|nr:MULTISPECIES: hypothetical protein [Francisella]APC92447.1 hypothetical protein BBG19_1723 [Francisella sp. MA067296]AXH30648.1 hypothetical protein CGC43_08730 [Francisella opportunistica]AXH32288.1 hypothetical protein CGC44_08700 [Francisella opportunistica]AXH33937.1 hypothetical protein CGC45_08760 [Francisella opportunistica]
MCNINKSKSKLENNKNTTNKLLLDYALRGNNFFFTIQLFDQVLPRQTGYLNFKNSLSQAAYLIEIIMSLNAGIASYEDEEGNIRMSFDASTDKADNYPLNSTLILRHDILRKAMLTCLGLLNYASPTSVRSYSHAVLRNLCSDLYICKDFKIKEVNDTFRNNLINFAEKALFVSQGEVEKFLLRCGEIGCAYKKMPKKIIRESSSQAETFRTVTTPLKPIPQDLDGIKNDNLIYLSRQKASATKALLGNSLDTDNQVLTSQARKFMPYSMRNTYTVDVKDLHSNKQYHFVLTASPSPEVANINTSECTLKYYNRLINAIQSRYNIANDRIQLISLVSESQPGKLYIGRDGNTAARRLGIKRANFQVTYTKGRGMRDATKEVLKHQQKNGTYVSILHCESGVDRAGTLLEHILYKLAGDSSNIIGGMAHGAFNAMLYNLQFGMKAKGIGYAGLERCKKRFQGVLSDKNKKFMTM